MVLDLGSLRTMSDQAVEVLQAFQARLMRRGASFKLCGVEPAVARSLEGPSLRPPARLSGRPDGHLVGLVIGPLRWAPPLDTWAGAASIDVGRSDRSILGDGTIRRSRPAGGPPAAPPIASPRVPRSTR